MRHDNVRFRFLGTDGGILRGEVVVSEDSMTIAIPEGEGDSPYLVAGHRVGTWFEGVSDCGVHVSAKWAEVGGSFVGLWIEGGDELLFSFELRQPVKR